MTPALRLLLAAMLLSITPLSARAQDGETPPTDVQVPLHSIVHVGSLPASGGRGPGGKVSLLVQDAAELADIKAELERDPGVLPPPLTFVPDTGVVAGPGPLAPNVVYGFEGVTNADNGALTGFSVLPPDPNMGVGPNHIFQTANIIGRITDKSGVALQSFPLHTFFGLTPSENESDPRMIYDAIGGRWLGTYLAYTGSSSSLVLAVSQSSDPTGAFCLYRLGNPSSETFLQDFPMLGVSDDKIVVSYNGFSFTTNGFVGSGFYVVNKADLLAVPASCAGTVRMTRFAPSIFRFTSFPAHSMTSTSDLFMPMHASASTLSVLRVSGVPGVGGGASATTTNLGIHSWTPPPSAVQPSTSQRLDTGDDRIISAAWQNNSLWISGTEACTPPTDSAARACVRAIQVDTSTMSVRQDMTYGALGMYYSYAAVRQDGSGNLHMVFAASSSGAFSGIRATGRLTTDPLNTLQASTQLHAGGGAQLNSAGRMGDYSGAGVDPSDPSSVWVMSEYIRSTASTDWGTFVARLQFPAVTPIPDLVVSAVGNPPATATAGDTFTASDTTQNVGTGSAAASTTRYYLSLDTVRDASDVLLTGSRSVPTLNAGDTSAGAAPVTIPATTPAGTYFLLACADDTAVVTESDETNNCRVSSTTMTVSAPPPDLVVSALGNPPASATAGSSFSVTDTTQNSGTGSAGASTTRYYLSLDTLKDASDALLTGTRPVPSLTGGASSAGTVSVTIPSGTAAGTYFLLGCADDLGVVTESNETNNCRASSTTVAVTVVTGPADLVVTAVTDPPATLAPGGSFSLTDTVQNVGGTSAAATVNRYYLSPDTIRNGNDILIGGSRSVPALAPGASSTGTIAVIVPTSTPNGTYYVLSCADQTFVVPESNETNNCRASAGTVALGATGAPDLVVTALNDPPTSALTGGSFSVTDTTQNNGTASAGASTTRYYLSLDTVKDASDTLMTGTRSVPTLAAGASSAGTVSVTIPGGTAAGTYFLLACADDTAVVTESNEANNCRASAGTVVVTVPLPDLVVSALTDPPANALTGGSFSVTDTTQNNGTGGAGVSTTRYYLSLDTAKDASDVLLTGTRAVGTLAAGASSPGTVSVIIPAATAAGTYFLLACADDTGVVTESNEANNCRASAGTVVVTVALPDLVVPALTDPPTSALTGGSFSVTDTTQNTGTASAGASTTQYYLSLDTLKDASDILLTGSRAVGTLAAGASSPGTVTVTIPAATAAGTYFLLACADDTSAVTESNETNNCRASAGTVVVTVPMPDLVVSALTEPPASALTGGSFSVTDTTQNNGTGSAGASTTRYYLSLDTAKDASDVLLTGTRAVGTLAAGASSPGTVSVTIPSGTTGGTYFLLACADDTNAVVESNEANNCRASAGTVVVSVPTPDLVVSALTEPPASALIGSSFSVTDTTQNTGTAGAGASTTQYYLSLDTLKDGGDVLLTGARAVGAVAAGASSAGSVSVTIPGGTAPGAYFLLACADDTGAVAESNEANNCRASVGTVTVTVATVDLVVSAVSDPPATLTAGSPFSVTDTTQNAGTAGAGASTTRYYLSLDTTKDASDVLLTGTRAVGALAAGASSAGTVSVTIPAGAATGTYFLLACADDTGAVAESNEANNCLSSTGTIQVTLPSGPADLVVSAVSDPPATVARGSSFTLTDTVLNSGGTTAPASSNRYYLSPDTIRNGNDVLTGGSRAVPALGPGASSTATATVIVPPTMAPGTYFVLSCADQTFVVTESNETNNCRATAGQVLVQ